MLTDALFAFGMLKLTSRMLALCSGARGARWMCGLMDQTGKPDGAGVRVNSQHSATRSQSLVCRDDGSGVCGVVCPMPDRVDIRVKGFVSSIRRVEDTKAVSLGVRCRIVGLSKGQSGTAEEEATRDGRGWRR